MAFDVLLLLFPIVLAIHNIDEYERHEQFIAAYHSPLPAGLTTRPAIFWAAVTLTVAAAVLCLCALIWHNPAILLVAKVSMCALVLNAVCHCLLSLKGRKMLPGTWSACMLVLPYGVIAFMVMRTSLAESATTIFRYALIGAVTIPLAIVVFLLLGNGIARLCTMVGSDESRGG